MASIRWNDACQNVRLYHPSASICWCSSGCLSLACLGRTCFYGNQHTRSQSWSGSLHASFCRSEVFTSISEEFGWYESSLSVSPWVTGNVCTLRSPFWCGVACVWLMCIRIFNWLAYTLVWVSAQRWLHILQSSSANHKKLTLPGEILHIRYVSSPSSLFCFDAFQRKKAQSDPQVHYLSVSLRWASLWCCCWSPFYRTEILNNSWENINHCVYNRHEWGQ